MSDPRAQLVLGVDSRMFTRQLRGAQTQVSTWGQRVSSSIRNSLRGAFDGLGGVIGLGGVAGFAAMTRSALEFDTRLTRLGISASKSKGEMLRLGDQLGTLAQATGVSRDEILAGAEAYTAATGDLNSYIASMDTLAKVQLATGANMDDLAKIAATFGQSLGVGSGDMLGVFDVLSTQAKMGAVELKDLAGELQGVAVGFSKFGDKGPAAAASLGAFLQVLKKGTPTAAEASNQLANLMSAVGGKASDALEKKGIKVFANRKTGEMRALSDILDEVIAKTDAADTKEIFGNDMQVNAALATYRKFRGEFDGLRKPAGASGVIMKDFGTMSETAGVKLAKMQETIKATFTAAVARNLDTLVSLMEKLAKALQWIGENPEALIALAAAFKGGSMLSGLGAGAAALAPGGAGGFSGPLTRNQGRMQAAFGRQLGAGDIGGVAQGAGVGLLVASTLGKGLGTVSSAAIVATHALAGLPGPIGTLGKVVAVLQDAALGLVDYVMDAKAKAVASSKFGAFYVDRADELAGANPGKLNASQASAAEAMAKQLASMGLLSVSAEGAAINAPGLKAQLEGDDSLNDAQRAALMGGSRAAARALDANPEMRGKLMRYQDKGLDAAFQTTTGMLANFGMGSGQTTAGLNAGLGGQTVRVVVDVAPGIAARVEDDHEQRRWSSR